METVGSSETVLFFYKTVQSTSQVTVTSKIEDFIAPHFHS
jgi:hypothetical protein